MLCRMPNISLSVESWLKTIKEKATRGNYQILCNPLCKSLFGLLLCLLALFLFSHLEFFFCETKELIYFMNIYFPMFAADSFVLTLLIWLCHQVRKDYSVSILPYFFIYLFFFISDEDGWPNQVSYKYNPWFMNPIYTKGPQV
jgi:hypothetical protein